MDADFAYGELPLQGPHGKISLERHVADWYAANSRPESDWTTVEDASFRGLQTYPGDDVFDASLVLQQLLETLRVGLRRLNEGEEYYIGPLIEMPNVQWAIATDGLYGIERPYRIEIDRLPDSREDWRGYMLSKEWWMAIVFLRRTIQRWISIELARLELFVNNPASNRVDNCSTDRRDQEAASSCATR